MNGNWLMTGNDCERTTRRPADTPVILIVDDSPPDRAIVSGLLEKSLACRTMESADGNDALAAFESVVPDIVLTDLLMPGMNGLELVSRIREDFPLVPVVLMTAKGNEDIAAEALRRGATSYVPKNLMAEDLVVTVSRILTGSQQQQRMPSRLMHHLLHSDFRFVLHNDPGLIRTFVDHLLDLLRCVPLRDETERLRVGVAVEETLKNAYIHGNLEAGGLLRDRKRAERDRILRIRASEEPWCNRRIHVSGRVSREGAWFRIRDEGHGFDWRPYIRSGTIGEQYPGRGIMLTLSTMDDVIYKDPGNEVVLRKDCYQE